jgi:predicted ATPase
MASEVRVAFCGASGTGKSTVAVHLAQALGVDFCDVGSRTVCKLLGFNSPYDVDSAGMRPVFQKLLLSKKREWEMDRASFVTDRTHFDNLVYSMLHCPEISSDAYIEEVVEACKIYTHVFFCPIGSFHDTAGDPDRVSDSDYHKRYEDRLIEACRRLAGHVPVYLLMPGTPAERLAEVMGRIGAE